MEREVVVVLSGALSAPVLASKSAKVQFTLQAAASLRFQSPTSSSECFFNQS